MSRHSQHHHQFLVQNRVRPAIEVLESDSTGPGFQLAAMVYGDSKEIVEARAEVVARALDLEGSYVHLKKALQVAGTYAWACRMYRQGKWPQPLYELLVWVFGAIADRESVINWLKEEFK